MKRTSKTFGRVIESLIIAFLVCNFSCGVWADQTDPSTTPPPAVPTAPGPGTATPPTAAQSPSNSNVPDEVKRDPVYQELMKQYLNKPSGRELPPIVSGPMQFPQPFPLNSNHGPGPIHSYGPHATPSYGPLPTLPSWGQSHGPSPYRMMMVPPMAHQGAINNSAGDGVWQAAESLLKAARLLESEEHRLRGQGQGQRADQIRNTMRAIRRQCVELMQSVGPDSY
jgi:hypothetical protein